MNDWITVRIPNWGQISYKMKCITKHQVWYETVTYGFRDIYAEFKRLTLSAYQYIHIKQGTEEIALW